MVYVEIEYRNQGYAKKLVEYILHYIKTVYPNTKKIILSPLPLGEGLPLQKLIRFYKKFGFKESKEHPVDKPYMMEIILKNKSS